MSSDRFSWMVIGIGIAQREDLSPSRCARDLLASGTMTLVHTGKKASAAATFVRLPGALVPSAGHAPFKALRQRFGFLQVRRLPGPLVPFAAHAPFEVLHQRFRFPQVRCVEAFCELLIDCLHQLQALSASTLSSPKARKVTRSAQFPATRLLSSRDLQAVDEDSLNFSGLCPACCL